MVAVASIFSEEGRELQRLVNGHTSKMPMTQTLQLVIY
jgi:hypothetical protein